ncbi:MAG TPA: hypothetical protein VJ208_03015, partial [Candidatus Nanoarchaeia archaeon]|nr:hypothetical protein [Candidatus Nanoarchaeia archaeon]
MKNKTMSLFALTLLVMAFAVAGVNAAALSTWALTANASASDVNSHLAVGDLTAVGVTGFVSSPSIIFASGWNSATFDSGKYYQVSLTAPTGFNFALTSTSFTHKITTGTTSTANVVLQWSKDSAFASPTNLSISNAISSEVAPLTSSITTNLPNIVAGETLYLRIFAYDADNVADTFNVTNLKVEGKAIPSEIVECSVNGDNGNLAIDTDEVSVEEGFGEDAE